MYFITGFRQPVLLNLQRNRLVAFAEGRNNTFCSGNENGARLDVVSRISQDGDLIYIETLHHSDTDNLFVYRKVAPRGVQFHSFTITLPLISLLRCMMTKPTSFI